MSQTNKRPRNEGITQVFCGPDGIILHATETLDIYLGECNYDAASQPSLAAIEVGDRIEIPFFHGDLCSERQ